MTYQERSRKTEDGDAVLPEYRPEAHPDVIFQVNSSEGMHCILPLAGDEYWVAGAWIVTSGHHTIMLRDRLFRLSELAGLILGSTTGLDVPGIGPAAGS
jgi:hypothetical protein